MPDIAELLDRTTPTDLGPPDLDAIVRRSHARHVRRRALAATLAAAAVLLAAVLAGTPAPGPGADPAHETTKIGPDDWTRLDDAPFAVTEATFAGQLSGGRVLIHDDEAGGAILDLDTGRWRTITDAPLPPRATVPFGYLTPMTVRQLNQDRLAVVTVGTDGRLYAAVYDVARKRWTQAPAVPFSGEDAFVAWDGHTLALVRAVLLNGSTPAATWRWHVGDRSWRAGAPPPLRDRARVWSAFDGKHLAVFGDDDRVAPRLAGGARYDVAADSWSTIPRRNVREPDRMATVGDGGPGDVVYGLGRPGVDATSLKPANALLRGETRPWGDFVEGDAVHVLADPDTRSGSPEPVLIEGPGGMVLTPQRVPADTGDIPLRDTTAPRVQLASGSREVALIGNTAWVLDGGG